MKRLRILAGPNGSGKSSLYKQLRKVENLNLGVFVNADEIEKELQTRHIISFDSYNISAGFQEVAEAYSYFFSSISSSCGLKDFEVIDNFLVLDKRASLGSYFASFVADFIRYKMIDSGIKTFTIETVMSHRGKLDLLKYAKERGYRVYLYFITTGNVLINESRVEARTMQGGHSVSTEKVRSRYLKSLDNAFDAMMLSDRAYFFDNSGTSPELVAEFDASRKQLLTPKGFPSWLNFYIVDKFFSHD